MQQQPGAAMDVSVEVHCDVCGSANYSLPAGAADEAPVACNDCGRLFGTVADLKAEMLEQALAHSAEALRRDLERFLDADRLRLDQPDA
jgi:hypothetical protein